MTDDRMNEERIESLDPAHFRLYTPDQGRCVSVGPQQSEVGLPSIPLPVHSEGDGDDPPSNDAIGKGIYDYLRQFPDCPLNRQYALVLRDAFPHYLHDLASQIVMLDSKEVDAPYVRRQIVYMKILHLIEPDNAGLLYQLGKSYMEVGLSFSQLGSVRQDFLKALGYLQRAVKLGVSDPATLNYLAQIDYWLGDYPSSLRRWRQVHESLDDSPARQAIGKKIEKIERDEVPPYPLVDDLEAVGEALELCAEKEYPQALEILERLEEQGLLVTEFSIPEFYYLLGLCREKLGDVGGAFSAYDSALELNPQYEEALQGKDRIVETGGL